MDARHRAHKTRQQCNAKVESPIFQKNVFCRDTEWPQEIAPSRRASGIETPRYKDGSTRARATLPGRCRLRETERVSSTNPDTGLQRRPLSKFHPRANAFGSR